MVSCGMKQLVENILGTENVKEIWLTEQEWDKAGEIVKELITTLPAREQRLIELRYNLEYDNTNNLMAFTAIAVRLKISPQYASRLHQNALRRFSHPSRRRSLKAAIARNFCEEPMKLKEVDFDSPESIRVLFQESFRELANLRAEMEAKFSKIERTLNVSGADKPEEEISRRDAKIAELENQVAELQQKLAERKGVV